MRTIKKGELFPIQSKISFGKVLEVLERQSSDPDENVATFAKNLLKEARKYPVLVEGFDDMSLLEKHKTIIDRLIRTLYPDILLTNEIKGITQPFGFPPFYYSTRMKNILEAAGGDDTFEPKGFTSDDLYIYACAAIMAQHYGYPVDIGIPMYIELPNKKQNLIRTYKLAFNADLLEYIPTATARDITIDDYHELMDNFRDIQLWRKKFPPNSWIIRGLGVANLMDVTIGQSVADITTSLLNKTPDSTLKIRERVKTLFNNSNIQVGFAAYKDDKFIQYANKDIDSLLLESHESMFCNDIFCEYSYHMLMDLRKPLVISDVDEFVSHSNGNIAQTLKKQNFQSFIAVPLIHEGEFLGLLELGAPNKYELNQSSLERLNLILPILCMAVSRFNNEFRNTIEAIIQQECTTIHPAVKWRFEEEACNYLLKKQRGEETHFQDLSFNEVYPLYGQLDIRNSSVKRNEAVQADLLTQINAVHKVLQRAFSKQPLPAYEELMFRTDGYKEEIEKGVLAGSELTVQTFFKNEVYPVFDHLKQSDKSLGRLVEAYERMLDKDLKFVYRKRKKLDDSMSRINQMLATQIDKKQEEAQQMFPHYFERYKTDGLEFNIYVGQSIVKNKTYHPVYLQSLRLWQLLTMCEMENEYRRLQRRSEPKLEIASLVLVYSTPLAIHFRQDEKRFDVEGSYNARYEIVKKRVDKAFIHGTKDRITQPGKIAIIYSNDRDAQEYKRYIRFLQSKDYLKKGVIEEHELQDLQGITGLRALRVSVAYQEGNVKRKDLSLDKIIQTLEKN